MSLLKAEMKGRLNYTMKTIEQLANNYNALPHTRSRIQLKAFELVEIIAHSEDMTDAIMLAWSAGVAAGIEYERNKNIRKRS